MDIVKYEKEKPPKEDYDGWEWHEVFGDARTLNNLVTRRVLKIVFKSNKSTSYRAVNVNALERAISDFQAMGRVEEEAEVIPDDLFNIVIGHDDKKEMVTRSINSTKPIHFLLWGNVASAKTLMLEELIRLPRSCFVLGSSLTRAGIFDVLFNERPKYLVIDELDKIIDTENLASLLSLMERGFVSETKYRRHRSLKLKTWVFASANRIERFPEELRSRFFLMHFKEYTPEEFKEITVDVLRAREDIGDVLALHIAEAVMRNLNSKDVRDSIRVARLLKKKSKEEVNFVIEVMRKQK